MLSHMFQAHLYPLVTGNKLTCCFCPAAVTGTSPLRDPGTAHESGGVGGGASWFRGGTFWGNRCVCWQGWCHSLAESPGRRLLSAAWTERDKGGGGEGHELPSSLLFFFPEEVWRRRPSRGAGGGGGEDHLNGAVCQGEREREMNER